MAMPQRDDLIEEIKRTDLLLEWAVQHGDEAEAGRLREKRLFFCMSYIQKRRESLPST